MAHDVFISYAQPDKLTADAVCARMEQQNLRCWMAPRDILPGEEWGAAIVRAIQNAKVLVLVFSAHANRSHEIPREVSLAAKHGLSIITFRIEDVAPAGSLDYNLNNVHWLDAITSPVERHIDRLAATLSTLLHREPPPQMQIPGSRLAKRTNQKAMAAGGVAVVVIALVALWLSKSLGSSGESTTAIASPVPPAPLPTPIVTSTPAPIVTPTPAPIVTSTPAPTAAPGSAQAKPPVILGCWGLPSAPGIIDVRADGTFTSGRVIKGTWRAIGDSGSEFMLLFPEDNGTAEMSADGRQLTLAGPINAPLFRPAGGTSIAGAWVWGNGTPVTFNADGTFTTPTFTGKWTLTGARSHALLWPGHRLVASIGPSGQSGTFSESRYGYSQQLSRLPCG